MKAIRVHQFGGPEVLKLEEVEALQPGQGQALIKLEAVGVNPVDTYLRSGVYPKLPDLPYTPGRDGAGTVHQVGPGCRFREGQRVYLSRSITGTYADFCLADNPQIHPLPDTVSAAAGACLGTPYVTAYQALFHRGQAQPGQHVLVRGASGAVGLAAVQLAIARGLKVTGTAGTEPGLKLVTEQGAHLVVGHNETVGPYDLILEMLADRNLDRDLDQAGQGATIVVIGNRGRTEIDARKTMTRELTIRGMSVMNATSRELERIHHALAAGLTNGSLKPVIKETLPLLRAGEAHQKVLEPGAGGNLVLEP